MSELEAWGREHTFVSIVLDCTFTNNKQRHSSTQKNRLSDTLLFLSSSSHHHTVLITQQSPRGSNAAYGIADTIMTHSDAENMSITS